VTRVDECLAVLELRRGCTPADVARAYRRLCQRYHPDRFAGDAEKSRAANELLAAINAAYSYLTGKPG
jgi:curved DNA-binding protein CbpA